MTRVRLSSICKMIIALGPVLVCQVLPVRSMEMVVTGDQLVLTGDVRTGDLERIKDALTSARVTTVILRNSVGGDAETGYRAGELFRERRLRTAVSGYCISSCSRMLLGGAVRAFTDDYPAQYTKVGFHGHYDGAGRLVPAAVAQFGLKSWILRFSDGKADEALVERWINIPVGRGAAYFFPASVAREHASSAFFCSGSEAGSIFTCERISHTALELGVITTNEVLHSNDQAEVRARLIGPPKSGFAALDDVARVPLLVEPGRAQYRAFLRAPVPRAFAIGPDGSSWAWNSGDLDAISHALNRCADRAGQPCQLYAVDDGVVWTLK